MDKKKTLSLTLATILIVGGVLAGCSSKSSTGSEQIPSASAGSKSAAPARPVKLDIMVVGAGLPSPDKDFVKQELDKALNVDINLTAFASLDDYKNQLNVRMASGNSPDFFWVDKAQIKMFGQQGQFLDLAPYLNKELKPVKDFIGEDSIKKGTTDGKVYVISKAPTIPYSTYWVRKDWLDKLKLQVPTTIEELMNVAKAFTEQDPDGNGKKDTYGITGLKISAFAPIFGGFGVALGGSGVAQGEFYVKDSKVVNSLYEPGMKDALAFINKWIASGSVDPELMANTGSQYQEKAIKGQAGIVWAGWPDLKKDQIWDQIKKVNPNAEWIQIVPPKGPVAQNDGSWDIGNSGGLYAIPKALEKDKVKLQKVFDLLNYISGKEGSLLVQFGQKGKHFNLEGDKVVPTELMAKETGYLWNYQFTGRPEKMYLSVKFAPLTPYMDFALKQPRIETLTGFVNIPDGFNKSDADRFIEEELTKFIYGKRPLTEYDAFLKTLDTSLNYKTYIDAATKQLKDLGYGK